MKDKKKPVDMTTDEVMEELFPPEAVEELKHLAQGDDEGCDELEAE